MTGMFDHFGQYAINFSMDLSTWDVSNVENMNRLFQDAFDESRGNILINLSNWNTSKVNNMTNMFLDTASRASGLTIVGIDHFDTKNVENMNYMFAYTGNMASNINDIGTLEVYASSMVGMFSASKNIQVVLNIHNPVTTYTGAFKNSATLIGSSITVNYTNDITNVDDIIATKSNDSHVVKGNLIP
jgi:hypothetical protein